MTEAIKVETLENAVLLRFNRPEIKNPLSVETLEYLREIFTALETDSTIEQIIFTGSDDTFASGANLKEIAALDEKEARLFGRRGQTVMQQIYHSRKLTVAAVDGFCMGGALDLAVSCKKRIASPRSVFAHPGVGLGIITGWSGTQILPRLIGEARALELFLTAKRIDAGEALRIRLINEIAEKPLDFVLANFQANRTS
jgi:enoyl-CoA hydratase